jgi:hypothetical protein
MRKPPTYVRALLLPFVALATVLSEPPQLVAATPSAPTPVANLRTMAKSPVSIEAGDFALDRSFHAATKSFEFELPPGTVPLESTDGWFLLDLNYVVTFGADSGPGFAWISAATNDATAAQLEYELRRSGELSIRESRVTLIDGQDSRELDGLSTGVEYTNYARDQGVRDGDNTFTLRAEHTEGVHIERVVFREDTGVSTTVVPPYPLAIDASLPIQAIRAGEEFAVTVTLENRSGVDLGDVVVDVAPADGVALPLDGTGHHVGRVEGIEDLVIRFEALRSGPGQITVRATSQRNTPSALLDLFVLPASGMSVTVLTLIAIAASAPVILGVAIVWVFARRRSRQRCN